MQFPVLDLGWSTQPHHSSISYAYTAKKKCGQIESVCNLKLMVSNLQNLIFRYLPPAVFKLQMFQWFTSTESCLQCQKWSPYKGRGAFSTPICVKKDGLASDDQGFSTASQGSSHVHSMSWLCPPTCPYPTFLLAQTYLWFGQLITHGQSCHDEYTHHQWLKG